MFFYILNKTRCCHPPGRTPRKTSEFVLNSEQPVKLITRLILSCCLTALLLACDSNPGTEQQAAPSATPVAPTAVATPAVTEPAATPLLPAGKSAIKLSSGKVSIRANQVYELDILNELATLANFQLLSGDIDWKIVSVDMQAQPLQAALGELLQDYPYEIVYAPDGDTQQEVLSEVVIGKLSAAEITASKDTAAANKALLKEIEALSKDGQQLAYTQQLQNPDIEIRATAAKKVKPVGDTFGMLTDMLVKDPSPEVRIATTWSLEMSDDPQVPAAIEALVKCLQDEDPAVVVECIRSLDFLGDETTVQYLAPMLTHADEGVRTEAADAIKSLQ
jgi:hypothetical protein